MDKSDSIKRFDDHNLDHYYKHLQNHGLAPRKQGFGIPPTIKGNKNVLGEANQQNGSQSEFKPVTNENNRSCTKT